MPIGAGLVQQRRLQTEQRPSADGFSGLHQESAERPDEPRALKTNDTATDASRIPRIERIARRARTSCSSSEAATVVVKWRIGCRRNKRSIAMSDGDQRVALIVHRVGGGSQKD